MRVLNELIADENRFASLCHASRLAAAGRRHIVRVDNPR
jgi:hypothetical protein